MLQANLVIANLASKILEQVGEVEVFPSIDSTNDHLLKRAKIQPQDISVCIAEQQTNGRGRRGKDWQSPKGASLSMSVTYPFKTAISNLSGLSLIVGLSLAKLLHQLGATAIQLKWPNDLLVADKKLAGILVELQQQSPTQATAIIGIGINITDSSEVQLTDNKPITALEELDLAVDPNKLAALILNQLLPALADFEQHGLERALKLWTQFDALKNRQLTVTQGAALHHGRYAGINSNGDLLLEVDGETKTFTSGEVSVSI